MLGGEEAIMVEDYIQQYAIHAMLNRLCSGDFKWDMTRNTLKTLAAMIEETLNYTWWRTLSF